VRASRDFASVEAWQVDQVARKANVNRGAEDLAAMRELDVAKLPEYAFARYVCREEMFPSAIQCQCSQGTYSRICRTHIKVRRVVVYLCNYISDSSLGILAFTRQKIHSVHKNTIYENLGAMQPWFDRPPDRRSSCCQFSVGGHGAPRPVHRECLIEAMTPRSRFDARQK